MGLPSETRYMRNAVTENVQFPTSYNLIKGNLYSGSLANLQASDDVYMVFASAAVDTTTQKVQKRELVRRQAVSTV